MPTQIEELLKVNIDELEKLSDEELTLKLQHLFVYTRPELKNKSIAKDGGGVTYKEAMAKQKSNPAKKLKVDQNKFLSEILAMAKLIPQKPKE